jgi:hypothetical protein
MLHFHHSLRDQRLLLCGHEDRPQTDLLDLDPALALKGEESANEYKEPEDTVVT